MLIRYRRGESELVRIPTFYFYKQQGFEFMRLFLLLAAAFSTMTFFATGCNPPPAVEERPASERIEVDVNDNDRDAVDDSDAGVDVQVGGGQGVQVDVDPNDS